jgi:hypothetical protein
MHRRSLCHALAVAVAMTAGTSASLAQVGTAFTYQGQLKSSGTVVNTPTDFQFSLFTAGSGGTQVGSTVTQSALPVAQGLFTSSVDFGVNPYTSPQALFLQIAVRNPAGSGPFIPMGTRQPLTPTPFSLATRGLTVDPNGNVGIGTAPPFNALDVATGAVIGNSTLLGTNANDALNQGTKVSFGWNTTDNSCGPIFGGMKVLVVPGTNGCGNSVDLSFATAECGTSCTREVMRLSGRGNVSVNSGSVLINNGAAGIGTASPAYRLHVFGSGSVTSGSTAPILLCESDGGSFGPQVRLKHNGTGGQEWVMVSGGSGNGGVSAGSFGLIRQGANGPAIVVNSAGACFNGTGTWSVLSDARLKQDIQPLPSGTVLDTVLSLHGVTFSYSGEAVAQKHLPSGVRTGFVAQDVEKNFPQWVSTDADGYKFISEQGTTALVVEALRDLRAEKDVQIDSLRSENDQLKVRLEKIEALLAAQAAKVEAK